MLKILSSLMLIAVSIQAHADVATHVKECFQDYAQTFLKDKPAKDPVAIRKRCLSAGFNKRWKKAVADGGADALLLSQDAPLSWDTVRIEQTKPENSKLQVYLGTGDEKQCLSVQVSKGLIDSVEQCKP